MDWVTRERLWKTTFLAATPSMASGLARLVDLGGVLDDYNRRDNADDVALAMDWFAVKSDIAHGLHLALQEQLFDPDLVGK